MDYNLNLTGTTTLQLFEPLFQSIAVQNLGTSRYFLLEGSEVAGMALNKLVISSDSVCEPISLWSAPKRPATQK